MTDPDRTEAGMMREDHVLDLLDPALKGLGAQGDGAESYSRPSLDVLRFYRRRVRLGWWPVVGRAQSVVAVVRQPGDVPAFASGSGEVLRRAAMAASWRYPPIVGGHGLSIGLTLVVVTPGPIADDESGELGKALATPLGRSRSVPLGIVRLDLDREVMAFVLAEGPGGLFPEPQATADALIPAFRRYLPRLDA